MLLKMEKEYFEIDLEKHSEEEEAAEKKKMKGKLLSSILHPFLQKQIADAYGGSENAQKLAAAYMSGLDALDEEHPPIPTPQAEKRNETAPPVKLGQGESNSVKPEGSSDAPPEASSGDPPEDEAAA